MIMITIMMFKKKGDAVGSTASSQQEGCWFDSGPSAFLQGVCMFKHSASARVSLRDPAMNWRAVVPTRRPADEAVPVLPGEEGGDGQVALLAGLAGVPVGLAGGAELQGADGTLDQLRQRRRVRLFELAHGLAVGGGAPRPAGVQQHLWRREHSSFRKRSVRCSRPKRTAVLSLSVSE